MHPRRLVGASGRPLNFTVLEAMKSYASSGGDPDFEVRYRFLTPAEGGRRSPPRQHLRWDFLYEGDDPQRDGIFMIWPEFIDDEGNPRPEGEVPSEGLAHMFILNPEMRPEHQRRISIGTRGFMVEGTKKVAECEVTRVLGLGEHGS
jgi:hypothetical protein